MANELEFDGTPTPEQAAGLIDAALGGEAVSAPPVDDAPEITEEAAPVDGAPASDPIDPPAEETVEATPEPPVAEFTPSPYIPQVREGAVERLSAIDQEMADLGTKLANDEIEIEDYHKRFTALSDERAEIKVEATLATEYARAAQHQAAQNWSAAQVQFYSQHGNAAYREDPLRHAALDAAVKAVASDPALANKPYDWILNEAKGRVERAFGIAEQPAAEKAAPHAQDIRVSAKAKVAAAKQAPPVSLTDIPGSPAAGPGEFEVVNGKSAVDMLDAVMGWPEEKRAAWLDRRI